MKAKKEEPQGDKNVWASGGSVRGPLHPGPWDASDGQSGPGCFASDSARIGYTETPSHRTRARGAAFP